MTLLTNALRREKLPRQARRNYEKYIRLSFEDQTHYQIDPFSFYGSRRPGREIQEMMCGLSHLALYGYSR